MKEIFDAQRQAFLRNPYPPAAERRDNLNRLRKGLIRRQEDFARAIHEDFGGRARMEVLFSEVFVSVHALRHAERHVDDWMRTRPVSIDWPLQPGRAYVMPQPVGVVGVISSWNYPVFVSIAPLAGALAAGNRLMLKPSELTPKTSQLLADLIGETFSPDHVKVVQGGPDTGREFASLQLDHLIFTGSTAVGRQIMRAAAENLTPLTLELGGKSPAIVAHDANLSRAAASIAYGKLLNAGQTCIAPDYALVARSRKDKFVSLLRESVEQQYPNAVSNADYTSIINERQFSRLCGYLDEARAAGCNVISIGGTIDTARHRIPPTVVVDPPASLRFMRDEIFGPILPVVAYSEIDEAIAYVNANPRPLAMYLFASSERLVERVLERTPAGGVTVNDTLVHIVAGNLPFGGAGASGFGAYHGQAGFDAVSKLKPVFRRVGVGLGVSLRPPYGRMHEWLRRILIR